MKIKLTSSVKILLFEQVEGLTESHPDISLRHLFGFEYGEKAQKATILTGVQNPLVKDWREASQMPAKNETTTEVVTDAEPAKDNDATDSAALSAPQSES